MDANSSRLCNVPINITRINGEDLDEDVNGHWVTDGVYCGERDGFPSRHGLYFLVICNLKVRNILNHFHNSRFNFGKNANFSTLAPSHSGQNQNDLVPGCVAA